MRQGGHGVHEQVTRRRHHAGLRNLQQVYRQMADPWMIYATSDRTPTLIVEEDYGMSSTVRELQDQKVRAKTHHRVDGGLVGRPWPTTFTAGVA